MEFVKYNSLENSYRERFMSSIFDNTDYEGIWYATEKLHGTNFSFLVTNDANDVTPCKRSGPILENEKFYNYKVVFDKYKELAKRISLFLDTDVQIYGEMVGPSIFNSPNYGEQDFYVFDILKKTDDGYKYLPFYTVVTLCMKFGFKVVPVLGYFESKQEALKYHDEWEAKDFEFESILGKGTAEGFVLKPNNSYELPSGKRVIIKCKTSKFSENKSKKTREKPKLSPENLKDLDIFNDYLNENRLDSALSKIGNKEDPKIFSTLLKEIIQDILEDIEKDEIKINKSLGREFSKVVSNFLKKNWLAKI